jgi:SpoIVB peptidase S55
MNARFSPLDDSPRRLRSTGVGLAARLRRSRQLDGSRQWRPRCPRGRAPAALFALLWGIAAVAGWTGPAAAQAGAASPPPATAAAANDRSAAKPADGALPVIGLDEVKIGQKGYGLSVFSGGQPERFDVEVIGVMRNLSPDMSYILARLSGRGLESSGVAAGMSGSPVFLDGRLAGAVSFGWPFAKEAVAGITPIASMRRLTNLGGAVPSVPPPPVELANLLAGKVPADLLERQLTRLRPRLGGAPDGALAGVEWSVSGFGELSRGVLRQALGSVAPVGRMATVPGARPPDLVPGSAVSAVLVSGDFQLSATGTVTDHLGDRILAFGHPFLGLGPIRVPMAAAEVVTVLSSQYTSFKIANLGPTVGAFEQDRQAGLEGRLGVAAPMIPMVLRIGAPSAPVLAPPLAPMPPRPGVPPLPIPGAAAAADLASDPGAGVIGAGVAGGAGAGVAAAAPAGPRTFHVELADVPELLPVLAGSTSLAGLESASYAGGPQSIDLTAHFRLARHHDLVIHQSFDGENAGSAMAAHLLALTAYLVQSPLARVRIEGIEVDVEQSPQPRAATLVGIHADRTVVHPGERLGVHVDLAAYRGDRFRHSFDVELPADLPVGRYSLLVGDGATADAARLTLAPIEPTTITQALALLASLHSRRDLTLLGFYSGAGLSVAGELMPRLPGSVRSLWAASEVSGTVPLRAAIVQERHETLGVPVEGLMRIDLEVRRREAPDGHEAPAPPGTDGHSSSDGTTVLEVDGTAPAAPAQGEL